MKHGLRKRSPSQEAYSLWGDKVTDVPVHQNKNKDLADQAEKESKHNRNSR